MKLETIGQLTDLVVAQFMSFGAKSFHGTKISNSLLFEKNGLGWEGTHSATFTRPRLATGFNDWIQLLI